MTPLLGAAAAVLAVLLVLLADALWRLLRRSRARRRAALALARHNQQAHEARLKSLEVITLAVLAGDCDLCEGCLRVRGLLRDYPGLRSAPEFAPIEALHEAIRNLSVGDARRRLPAAEIARQDAFRRDVEGRHRAAVLASFRVLRQRAQDLAGSRYDLPLALGAPTEARASGNPVAIDAGS